MNMNPILSSHFNSFQDEYGYKEKSISDAFEAFTLNIIAKQKQITSFEIRDSVVGEASDSGEDGGIDGIIVVINGRAHYEKQLIEEEIKNSAHPQIEFIFVQAKSSPKFDAGDIAKFCHGVKEFFNIHSTFNFNSKIQGFKDLKKEIYSNAVYFVDNPSVCCYYMTTGEWLSPRTPVSHFETFKTGLRELNIFSEVLWKAYGENEIVSSSKITKNRLKSKLRMPNCVVVPAIKGVQEAFVGIASCKDFLNLITDDEGKLIKSIFNDNIRDFQGDNPVNQGIQESLANKEVQDRFILLNNGVTLVARKAKRTGDEFTLTDFQIVNGCQTSNMLYFSRDSLADDTAIPIKLVSTNDLELTNEVVQATNRQTTVAPEAFESLQPFHKELEDYYIAMKEKGHELYYERRAKQYEFDTAVKKHKIVSLAKQTKAFTSIFLHKPYSAHTYYGSVLVDNKERLYFDDHCQSAYFCSSALVYHVEEAISKGAVPDSYRRWRYHLAMILRMELGGKKIPSIISKEMNKYTTLILQKLLEDSDFSNLKKSIETLKSKAKSHKYSLNRRDLHHDKEFVENFIIKQNKIVAETSNKMIKGDIKVYDRWKGYGFVKVEGSDESIFFHISDLDKVPFRFRYQGIPLIFTKEYSDKGACAQNIVIDHEEYSKRFKS